MSETFLTTKFQSNMFKTSIAFTFLLVTQEHLDYN